MEAQETRCHNTQKKLTQWFITWLSVVDNIKKALGQRLVFTGVVSMLVEWNYCLYYHLTLSQRHEQDWLLKLFFQLY